MKDKEVLQKAIEIAIENGFIPNYKPFSWFPKDAKVTKQQFMFLESKKPTLSNYNIEILITFNNDRFLLDKIKTDENIIFSHDFAKAFWTEEGTMHVSNPEHGLLIVSVWMMHLQQMVLEPNPIDYLRKFIKD